MSLQRGLAVLTAPELAGAGHVIFGLARRFSVRLLVLVIDEVV